METSGRPCFCSWSGGKDSCLALYHAVRQGYKPMALLTMMAEDGERSRSHGLPRVFLEAQARSLDLPIIFQAASWPDYERTFLASLERFCREGLAAGVFGDIDVEDNRAWVRGVCARAGIEAVHPLWARPRRDLLAEFIALGFKAVIVSLRADKLDLAFLGKEITAATVDALAKTGIDPSGELGEYHTAVTAGPLFAAPVPLPPGKPREHGGYWFLDAAGTAEADILPGP